MFKKMLIWTVLIFFMSNGLVQAGSPEFVVIDKIKYDCDDPKMLFVKSMATSMEEFKKNSFEWQKEMIKNGNFDIVVLQEYSMGAIDEPDSLLKYSNLFCDFIKENKAKPIFYLTWAREKVPQYQEIINKTYLQAATENEADIVPVGIAWALAQQYRPDIELFNPDGSHPSDLGAFLTACIFVATILDEIPEKINGIFTSFDLYGESIKLMAIHPLDVAFCIKITEETVLK